MLFDRFVDFLVVSSELILELEALFDFGTLGFISINFDNDSRHVLIDIVKALSLNKKKLTITHVYRSNG